jgi:hypothetical protein
MHASLLHALLLFAAPIQSPPQGTIPLNGGVLNPLFKRICVGDFDRSGQPDAVFVRDNYLDIVGDPATFGWYTGELGSVRDVALLAAGGVVADDRVVSVGTSGVQEWRAFQQANGNGASAPTVTNLDPAGGEWVGSRRVATKVFAGEARPRIVGSMTNFRSVRILQDLGSGYNDHELSFSPAIDEDILDLAWVNYFNDSTPELSILTATKLRIYSVPLTLNPSGPTATTHVVTLTTPAGWTEECMTVGAYPAGHVDALKEWVAVVLNHSNGIQQYLTIVDYGGAHASILLQGNPDVTGMDAGPYDDNGTMDLLLSNNASNTLWILKDTNTASSGSPVFSVAPENKVVLTTYSTVTGTQNTQCTPALADFDNDGDLDVLTGVRSTASLFLSWNQKEEESKYRPSIIGVQPTGGVPAPQVQHCSPTSLLAKLTVDPPETWPTDATHLEIAVFRKATINSTTERASAPSLRIPKAQVPAPETTPLLITRDFLNTVFSYPGPTYSQPSDEGCFENFYLVYGRWINLNGDGTVQTAYPVSWHGAEASIVPPEEGFDDSPNAEYLHAMASGSWLPLYYNCCECQSGIGNAIGTVTPLPAMPTPPGGPVVVTPPL